MSEYWKSTPKYWCKFCAVYVKDTKFERAQHEATGRHQGSIQRSLRGLHREQEAEQRTKARAQAEVARLNGLVPTASPSVATGTGGPPPTFEKRVEKKATVEDRKRQWDQLAAMGVALPEEARTDMGMAGDWKVVKQEVVGVVSGDGEFKAMALNKGVHKRMPDEDEEEAREREMITKKKGWGHTYKTFPGSKGEVDVDSLFGAVGRDAGVKVEREGTVEESVKEEVKEEGETTKLSDIPTVEESRAGVAEVGRNKSTDGEAAPAVTFKKRKKKA
ncbi:U1 zinc finger domain-containing protein [Dothidotthia symphoricarpi CBS 119687]|uniref:U1 zinc finger domain-containing protein n=1 Tax=Dothidotthia symphoricarpi CBS 119687 TaxID=1392245 RepID=A0A6A6AIG9_9PLEO|nr:U1 zinc finger domain-containing protein [Dothidotthia symphoricarpi CBS 119687]KAF2131749.1 U1 zinc finger domain-containing protein [Dothidotthia symphoricarpi CBS 119687]